jgi:ferredoxin
VHGKGRGIKACDTRAASLCHACHMAVDQGRVMSRSEREHLWMAAHVKTVRELVRLGLWPLNVSIPDLPNVDV